MTPSVQDDNTEYEAWLRKQCDVVEADLAFKHERMRKNVFVFLRATYFRWARRIPELYSDLEDAPAVLSVGDLHAENFGTWRDAEARLVWGVNDFDDTANIPYPFDLLRLATSIRVSPASTLRGRDAAAALLEGYVAGLSAPRPVLLDEQETWMRPYVASTDKDRQKFWDDIDAYEDAVPPGPVARALTRCLPESASLIRFAKRAKGGGSLGRPRYLAIASWRGGRIVREAKALVPSAWDWARSAKKKPSRFLELATGRYRSPDPHLRVTNGYIVRRIASDARKADWSEGGPALTTQFINTMGFDVGAIHAATEHAADRVRADLARRNKGWLNDAAKTAAVAVETDYDAWLRRR